MGAGAALGSEIELGGEIDAILWSFSGCGDVGAVGIPLRYYIAVDVRAGQNVDLLH